MDEAKTFLAGKVIFQIENRLLVIKKSDLANGFSCQFQR